MSTILSWIYKINWNIFPINNTPSKELTHLTILKYMNKGFKYAINKNLYKELKQFLIDKKVEFKEIDFKDLK